MAPMEQLISSAAPRSTNPYADVAGNGSEANTLPLRHSEAWLRDQLERVRVDWTPSRLRSQGYAVPYTYNFNLNIQRQFGSHYLMQVGYVGSLRPSAVDMVRRRSHYPSRPRGLPRQPFLQGTACVCPQALSPVHGAARTGSQRGRLGTIPLAYRAPKAYIQTYNSLQASIIKALDHGLQFSLAYTYSHALDDGSGI